MRLLPGEGMSTLQGTLRTRVQSLAALELHKMCLESEISDWPEISNIEIAVDVDHLRGGLLLQIDFSRDRSWSKKITVSSYADMSEGELENRVSAAMRNNISILGQMHYVRLHKLFPNSIKDVQIQYKPETHEKIVQVLFKNGHRAEATEHESKGELFIAKCSMLYDLPPI